MKDRTSFVSLFFVLFLFFINCQGFDLGWKYGELAFQKCKQKEIPSMKGMCGKFQEIVEDAFDDQGMQLQNAFGNSFSQAVEVANRPAFAKFGEKTIEETVDWMFDNKIRDYEKLKGEYINKFFKWFAEVLKEVDQPGTGLQFQDGFDLNNLPPIPHGEL